MSELNINPEKKEIIEVDGISYRRLPVKTKVVTADDDMADIAAEFAKPYVEEGDILFVSEKATACSQGRAVPVADIKPRLLARFLVKFVYKTPYGIGLGMPETLEMAFREVGTPRILLASAVSAVGKLIGKRGWFYKVAGYRAETIDGPAYYVIPPYNKCVVLGPLDPDGVAKRISEATGVKACIVDINDHAGQVLGRSHEDIDKSLILRILKDNPLGQTSECTPIGIIRKA